MSSLLIHTFSVFKGAVYTVVWILSRVSCMFLELFLFAKKIKFLTDGA